MFKKLLLGTFMALSLAASSCAPAYAQEAPKAEECYDKVALLNTLAEAAKIDQSLNQYVVATLNPDASRFFIKSFIELGGPTPPEPWDGVTLVYNPGDPTAPAFLYIMNEGCGTVHMRLPGVFLNQLLRSASN